MKKLEISTGQMMLASSLSERAKDRCRFYGIEARRCEPHHFYGTVINYNEKLNNLGQLMDRCFIFCESKGVKFFTPQRLANWCDIELQKHQRRESKFREMDQLKNGNQHQVAEYHRRQSQEQRNQPQKQEDEEMIDNSEMADRIDALF